MSQTSRAITCPNCGRLISDYFVICPHCGLKKPAKKKSLALPKWSGVHQSLLPAIMWFSGGMLLLSYIIPVFFGGNITLSFGRGIVAFFPTPSSAALKILGWADPRDLLNGDWWMLVTAVFLHGGVLHIAMNLLWLRNLGQMTEKIFTIYGSFFLFLFGGITGNFLAIYWPYFANETLNIPTMYHPVVGASGGIFGLLGALVAHGHRLGGWRGKEFSKQFATWAVVMILFGFLMEGVSNTAHIGGFIGGYLAGRLIPTSSHNQALLGLGSIGVFLVSYFFLAIRFFSLL